MSRICFLINNMSHGGGTERVTSLLANALCEDNEVFIYSCREGMTTAFEVDKRVSVTSFGGERIVNSVARKLHVRSMLASAFIKDKIDCAIAVDLDMCLYFASLKGLMKKYGIKTIAWEHFVYEYHKGMKGIVARHLAVHFCNKIVVLSESDKSRYISRYGSNINVEQIYNPLSVSIKSKTDYDTKTVLAVGRLEAVKGFDLLIRAWSLINKKCPDWKLRIVGSGRTGEDLRKLISELKISNVEMIPFTPDVDRYYEDAEIFALSSQYEGYGLVLLEAQAKGLPTVSFACLGGPKEIVKDGVNGYLVESGDIKALSERLYELICNEELRKQFSAHAMDDLGKYDINLVTNRWEKLIASVCCPLN